MMRLTWLLRRLDHRTEVPASTASFEQATVRMETTTSTSAAGTNRFQSSFTGFIFMGVGYSVEKVGFWPVPSGGLIKDFPVTSPMFDRITIRLHNGKKLTMSCHNNSRDNKHIQSIVLNGRPLNRVWFKHADIVNGGMLELQIGNVPNEKLGTNPDEFPPSARLLGPM